LVKDGYDIGLHL